MKARSGFVSNSSSSSFVIIGKRIDRSQIKDFDNVWLIGENCDAAEVIELNDELKNAILEHDIEGDFWHAYYTAFDGDNTLAQANAEAMFHAGDMEVETCEVSQWDSYEQEGLEGFLKNYLEDYFDPNEEPEDQ